MDLYRSVAISNTNINTYTDPLCGIMVSNLHRSTKQYLRLWAAFIVGCESTGLELGLETVEVGWWWDHRERRGKLISAVFIAKKH